MKIFFIAFFFSIAFVSCNQHDKQSGNSVSKDSISADHKANLKKMEWLVGTWKGKADTTTFYEAWRKVNDTLFMNYGIDINGTDSFISGATPFGVRGGRIILAAEDSTGWHLTKVTDDEIVLNTNKENAVNEITWKYTKEGHWLTTIKNSQKTVTYDLEKIPELDKWVDVKRNQ